MARPSNGYEVDGQPVPGVTTIVGRGANKEGLIGWAVSLAKRGKNHIEARDSAALIGTLTHELIESYLRDGRTCSDSCAPELATAIECFKSWREWWIASDFEVVELELPLVSPSRMFGGTIDAILADGFGRLWVYDWKTSSSIYSQVPIQLSGYVDLYEEVTGNKVYGAGALHINKKGGVRPYEWLASSLGNARQAFRAAHVLYQTDKDLDWLTTEGKQNRFSETETE